MDFLQEYAVWGMFVTLGLGLAAMVAAAQRLWVLSYWLLGAQITSVAMQFLGTLIALARFTR